MKHILIIISSCILALAFVYMSWIFLSITKILSENDKEYIQKLEKENDKEYIQKLEKEIDVLERVIRDQSGIIKEKRENYERVIN